jgi:hypothetical protein
VAKDFGGGAGAQDVGDHRLGQGEQLAAGAVSAGAVTEVDQVVDELLDAEPFGQRCG